MARSWRYLIPALAALALLSAGGGEPAREPPRVVRFRVLATWGAAQMSYAAAPDAPRERVRLFPTMLSAEHAFTGDGAMSLFDEDGRPAGAIEFPPRSGAYLVVLTRADSGGTEGRVIHHVVDTRELSRPAGTLTILNLSGLVLEGSAGGRPLVVPAGLNPPLALGASSELALTVDVGGRRFRAFSERVETEPGMRSWLVLLPPLRAGAIEPQWRLVTDAPDIRGFPYP